MKTKSALLLSALSLSLMSCASTATDSSPGAPPASSVKTGKVKPWPKNTCVVSGNELGSMGAVITKVHKDQEVKFCCKPCVKKFDANPDKYLKGI